MQFWQQTIAAAVDKIFFKVWDNTWRQYCKSFTPFTDYWKGEKKLNKWVLNELNKHQKLLKFEVCLMLCMVTNDVFLTELSLVNDLVNGFIVMSTTNTSHAKVALAKKYGGLKLVLSTTTFWKTNQSITAINLQICMLPYKKIRHALVNRRGPILLHNNTRSHVARLTLQKLTDLR